MKPALLWYDNNAWLVLYGSVEGLMDWRRR